MPAGDTGQRMIAVFANPMAPELARTLDLGGYAWKALTSGDDAAEHQPGGGWHAIVIDCSGDPESGWAFASAVRKSTDATVKTMVLVSGGQLSDLELRDDLFDDFCLAPFHPSELEARLRHLLWSSGEPISRADLVEYGDLVLNLETYQATIQKRPLDLTYMEYELLKFLTQNPGKVFTREMLLSRVWGYEYYGGARTVDVHIRRLRAKLGEEHANLIQTVRSVGYRFGQSRWGS
jgi:DNA-binding response OmpR family regulator